MTIRSQLAVLFVLLFGTIFLFAFTFIHGTYKTNLEKSHINKLEEEASRFEKLITSKAILGDTINTNKLESIIKRYRIGKEKIDVIGIDGTQLYADEGSKIVALIQKYPIEEDLIEHKYNLGDNYFYGIQIKGAQENSAVLLFISRKIDLTELSALDNILILTFFVSIIFVGFVGWIYANFALRPLYKVIDDMNQIQPDDLIKRLEIRKNNDAISWLILRFNSLLDRIQQAFENQKMFISNVSHELKNPLSLIQSQIEVSLSKERNSKVYIETLESILEDVKNINSLSIKLFQLARTGISPNELEMSKIRIDEVIWKAKNTILKSNPAYTIQYEIEQLPHEEESLYIIANEELLSIALINLIDNGCKYSPDQKVSVLLNVSDVGHIQVRVVDNGSGIDESDISKLFNLFFRGNKYKNEVNGSGIGLVLVHNIMKIHNIDLRVETSNKGTSMNLSFP